MLLLGVIITSGLATWVASQYARRCGLIDHPGHRRSHDRPIARAGGLGPVLIFLSFCLGQVTATNSGAGQAYTDALLIIVLAMSAVATLGFWDDHRSLSARIRLAVQTVVCSVLLIGLMRVLEPSVNPILAIPTLLLVLGMLNAFNFMDGSHGMAASQGLFVSLVVAALLTANGDPMAWSAMVLAACILGFFPFNFPNPRVFLGDVGSLGIGCALSGLLLYTWLQGLMSWWEMVVLMQVFLVDTGLTLADRIRRREQWYTSHRDHAYQRLLQNGWSHAGVMGLYVLLNLAVTLPGVWLIQNRLIPAQGVVAGSLLLLGTGWVMVQKMTRKNHTG